jgi:uncharacterized membrane protein YkvA (DUF1232 family)
MRPILEGEILGPEDDTSREKRVRSRFWATLKKAARQIPFSESLVAAYYCALDPATPTRVRATLLAALAYFVMPVDAIPDVLVGIGFSDDATVLLAAIAMVRAHITPEHRAAARQAMADHW